MSNVVKLFPSPSRAKRKKIIVDEAAAKDLILVALEPTLGPLARELFETEEKLGNMLGDDKRRKVLEGRERALEWEIFDCRAETLPGITWRLLRLLTALKNEDMLWEADMVQAVIRDTTALYRATVSAPR
jgi:hypothetical protein